MSQGEESAWRHRRFASPNRGAAMWERPACRWGLAHARTDTCASRRSCHRPTCQWANLETSRPWLARTEFQSPDRKPELFGRAAFATIFSKTCWKLSSWRSLTSCWKKSWQAFSCWRQCWRDDCSQWNCSSRFSSQPPWATRRCQRRVSLTRICWEDFCCWWRLCSDRNSPAHPALLTTSSAEPEVPDEGFS